MLEQKSGPWDFRVLPNKMYELVKNLGEMKRQGTGYFTDTESEMITVLQYLNYGETTNTTESMREQIDEAVKNAENNSSLEKEEKFEGRIGEEFMDFGFHGGDSPDQKKEQGLSLDLKFRF